jgi:hypothetical protein
MAERGWIEAMVERVVAEVLESHTAQLRDEIVRRVRKEISEAPSEETPTSPSNAASANLASAVAEIQLGTTQKEILRALLDSCARHAARVALFVVRGGNATGWQGRGFSSSDAVKDFALDVNAPAVVRAVSDRVVVEARTTDLDARFLQDFGTPSSGESRLLPLVLKDKVAALVYADGGTEGANSIDAGALELLVLSTSAWLEINSLRKQAKEPAVERAEAGPAVVEQAAVSQIDPFAAHTPSHAMAAAAAAEAPPPANVAPPDAPVAVVEPESAVAAADAAAAPPAAPPAVSDEEQAIHQKAQRFARLLVDEIKLYNLAKVTEGRKNKDLYDRLKETIEKSRATFAKRYGNTLAAGGDYFQHELIRSLAEDDISIMGANFRQ